MNLRLGFCIAINSIVFGVSVIYFDLAVLIPLTITWFTGAFLSLEDDQTPYPPSDPAPTV